MPRCGNLHPDHWLHIRVGKDIFCYYVISYNAIGQLLQIGQFEVQEPAIVWQAYYFSGELGVIVAITLLSKP